MDKSKVLDTRTPKMNKTRVAAYALHFYSQYFGAVLDTNAIDQQLLKLRPKIGANMSALEIEAGEKLILKMSKPGNFLKALDTVATN